MIDKETFDPRQAEYKAPYGAVASGERVHFTLRPLRRSAFVRGVLTARLEGEGGRRVEVAMPWSGVDGVREVFTGTLATGGLVGRIW